MDQALVKYAQAIINMGNPSVAGKGLADICKFLLTRIPESGRAKALDNLRNKILVLNEYEISGKSMPAYSSLGQSLSFVQNVLHGHDPAYVRRVLNAIAAYL